MPKGAAAAKRPQAPPRVRPGDAEEPAANNSSTSIRASESTKHVLQTLSQHAHEDSAVLSHLDLSSLHWQSNPGHVVEVLLNSLGRASGGGVRRRASGGGGGRRGRGDGCGGGGDGDGRARGAQASGRGGSSCASPAGRAAAYRHRHGGRRASAGRRRTTGSRLRE